MIYDELIEEEPIFECTIDDSWDVYITASRDDELSPDGRVRMIRPTMLQFKFIHSHADSSITFDSVEGYTFKRSEYSHDPDSLVGVDWVKMKTANGSVYVVNVEHPASSWIKKTIRPDGSIEYTRR